MNPISPEQRNEILRIASTYGASNVRLFGSYVQTDGSSARDLDLLVDLAQGRSLLDQVGLKQDIEELLGTTVDIVVDGGVSPYLQERIYSEAVPL